MSARTGTGGAWGAQHIHVQLCGRGDRRKGKGAGAGSERGDRKVRNAERGSGQGSRERDSDHYNGTTRENCSLWCELEAATTPPAPPVTCTRPPAQYTHSSHINASNILLQHCRATYQSVHCPRHISRSPPLSAVAVPNDPLLPSLLAHPRPQSTQYACASPSRAARPLAAIATVEDLPQPSLLLVLIVSGAHLAEAVAHV